MTLIVLGINHKSAPLALREHVALPSARLTLALENVREQGISQEVAIVSTCHRTEIYAYNTQPDQLVSWLSQRCTNAFELLKKHLYQYHDAAAVAHMMRVASGMDSMILGEPQILGQMKTAFCAAKEAGTLGVHLDRLFQHTFSVAKKVRARTPIGARPVSLAFIAAKLAEEVFPKLSAATALVIGMGNTMQLAYQHLTERGVSQFIVANRDVAKARHWLQHRPGRVIALGEIPAVLAKADIILSATASPLPIIGKGRVESAMKQREQRPMLFIDLAMPRDIEPEVSECESVHLYNVDDLEGMVKDNLSHREQALIAAETLITQGVGEYRLWVETRQQVHTIAKYQERLQGLSEKALKKAEIALANGHDPTHVLTRFSHEMTQKILCAPARYLRNQPIDASLAQQVKGLLGIDVHSKS